MTLSELWEYCKGGVPQQPYEVCDALNTLGIFRTVLKYDKEKEYYFEEKQEPQNAIHVWRFKDAPEEYKLLSPAGGDEDWLAFVPSHYTNEDVYLRWLEDGYFDTCCDPYIIPVKGGRVYIGCH